MILQIEFIPNAEFALSIEIKNHLAQAAYKSPILYYTKFDKKSNRDYFINSLLAAKIEGLRSSNKLENNAELC